MRLILPIVVSALTLAGCAADYDKSAETPGCRRLAGADHTIVQMSGPGLVTIGGYAMPGRDLGGSGKLDMEWGNSSSCIRQEDNGSKPPKSYDLHKIGMAV